MQEIHPHKFDAGALLHQTRLPVPPRATYSDLVRLLAPAGAQAVAEVLADLPGARARAWTQDELLVTEAPKIPTAAGRVNWAGSSAVHVDRLVRAVGDRQSVSCELEGVHLRVRGAVAVEDGEEVVGRLPSDAGAHTRAASRTATRRRPPYPLPTAAAGDCFYDKREKRLLVRCAQGWVDLTVLQKAHKKPTSAANVVNGLRGRRAGQPMRMKVW